MLPHTLLVVLFAVFATLLHTCLVRHQFTSTALRSVDVVARYRLPTL